jgi:hypothetical protein
VCKTAHAPLLSLLLPLLLVLSVLSVPHSSHHFLKKMMLATTITAFTSFSPPLPMPLVQSYSTQTERQILH